MRAWGLMAIGVAKVVRGLGWPVGSVVGALLFLAQFPRSESLGPDAMRFLFVLAIFISAAVGSAIFGALATALEHTVPQDVELQGLSVLRILFGLLLCLTVGVVFSTVPGIMLLAIIDDHSLPGILIGVSFGVAFGGCGALALALAWTVLKPQSVGDRQAAAAFFVNGGRVGALPFKVGLGATCVIAVAVSLALTLTRPN